jgi:hypothetical protein
MGALAACAASQREPVMPEVVRSPRVLEPCTAGDAARRQAVRNRRARSRPPRNRHHPLYGSVRVSALRIRLTGSRAW